MAIKKYVSPNKLLLFWENLKTYFTKQSDFDALEERVDEIASIGGEPNKIDSIKVNGTAQTITNKIVDISIPTNNNQLTNGAGYQTASDVSTAIDIATENKADKADSLSKYGITDAYTKSEVDSAIEALDTGVTSVNGNTGAVTITAASIGALTEHQDITGKADKATTLSGYGITNAYTKAEVDTAISNSISSVYKIKGSVDTYATLPSSGLTIGDVYNVVAAYGDYPAGTNWVYTENGWDALGGSVDLSDFVLSSDWEETDTTNNAYILNKPAIKAGNGENGVLIGQTEQAEAAQIFTLYLTGEGGATTFSYITEDDLSGITSSLFKRQGLLFDESVSNHYRYITDIDTTQHIISINSQLSNSAVTNRKILLYYGYKMSNDNSVAEGEQTRAVGVHSHAEGYNTVAIGASCHAEGTGTLAENLCSHAEGSFSTASGMGTHTEGSHTIASGSYSHAEGSYTTASGSRSHAEGSYTTAQRRSQHVFGEYNILDVEGDTGSRGSYVEIVGNGASESTRSNARTLDWSGNEVLAGKLTVGTEPTEDMDVTTKQYVDNAISNIPSSNPLITATFTKTGTTMLPNFGIVDTYSWILKEDDKIISTNRIAYITNHYINTPIFGLIVNSEGDTLKQGLTLVGLDSNGILFAGQQFNVAFPVQSAYGIYILSDSGDTSCIGASLPMARYNEATTSDSGLMSAQDKTDLDSLLTRIEIQSDWSVTDSTSDAFIKNKPTNISAFTNDSGYQTASQVNTLIQTALSAYGDGDTATYGTSS